MPRGGKRQGTPGKGYSNRTDLAMDPDMSQGTAAAGGMEPPPAMMTRAPEDTPMLLDPTTRPQEPLTAGMASGPGVGPEALGLDPRMAEVAKMREKWMPMLQPIADDPDTPDSVKMLIRHLRSA
jgi:hypothetical protein